MSRRRRDPRTPAPRDPFKSREYQAYAQHFFDEVAPKLSSSAFTITVAPVQSKADVKIATELGFSILLDKPLVVYVPKGRREHVAPKLLRIADYVIEGDFDTEAGRAEAQAKLLAWMKQ